MVKRTRKTLKGEAKLPSLIRELPKHPIENTDAYEEYLHYVSSPRTTKYALQVILRNLSPCVLKELTPIAVSHALDKMLADGYKPTTVDRHKRILRAFLNFCQNNGYCNLNAAAVAKKVDMRQVRNFIPPVLQEDMKSKLDAYFRDPANVSVDMMFLWSGLKGGHRISEVAMVTAGDIEMHQVAGNPEEYEPWIWLGTKTNKRKVPFPRWIAPALLAFLESAMGDETRPVMYLGGSPVIFAPSPSATTQKRATYARKQFYDHQRIVLGGVYINPHALRADYIRRAYQAYPTMLGLESIAKHVGNTPDIIRKHYLNMENMGPQDLGEL